MKNTPQKPALSDVVTSKLRSRRGHTLVEQLTVLLLISFFSIIALVVINYASRTTTLIITRSRVRTVSDTINETLHGILRCSSYIRTESETVYFLSESYSGWESSLEAVDGLVFMHFYDGDENRREKILSDPSYAGFSVENFRLDFEDDVYNVKYLLTKDGYEEDFDFSVPSSD